ncbi:GNAT family N-acetyltransferase [Faecalispora anaeroviscerum]|uniref:GNAT family N-acetyltransferase n=1 Tax=Faecalispora anaeroviscerum TaxID=2991836 RepID=UPI0024BADC4B|nr:GNAT family N-acetyltransferase [Faecalispora anaeroviscerum]
MSGRIIRLARWGMQPELEMIWQACFGDPKRPTAYFFNNAFQPRTCLVYEIDGRAAAMVHMLPVRMVQPGGEVRGHYIYAASTLPQYRKQGCMGALLRAAAHLGLKRGEHFSCLLPSSDALYDYYANYGYEEAFFTRFVTASAEELSQLSAGAQRGRVIIGYSKMREIRKEQLSSLWGSVLWEERALCFAEGFNRQYGGKLIAAQADDGGAYALCRRLADGSCEVTELMADEAAFPALIGQLLAEMPAHSYHLRLPENGALFPERGELRRFGMLRPLRPVELNGKAYLGLTLD